MSSDTGWMPSFFLCIVETSSCILLHSVQYAFCRFVILEEMHPTSCKMSVAMSGAWGPLRLGTDLHGRHPNHFYQPCAIVFPAGAVNNMLQGYNLAKCCHSSTL